ncbi:hypothetical protein L9F63_014490, partial [Diploptera punctata]
LFVLPGYVSCKSTIDEGFLTCRLSLVVSLQDRGLPDLFSLAGLVVSCKSTRLRIVIEVCLTCRLVVSCLPDLLVVSCKSTRLRLVVSCKSTRLRSARPVSCKSTRSRLAVSWKSTGSRLVLEVYRIEVCLTCRLVVSCKSTRLRLVVSCKSTRLRLIVSCKSTIL